MRFFPNTWNLLHAAHVLQNDQRNLFLDTDFERIVSCFFVCMSMCLSLLSVSRVLYSVRWSDTQTPYMHLKLLDQKCTSSASLTLAAFQYARWCELKVLLPIYHHAQNRCECVSCVPRWFRFQGFRLLFTIQVSLANIVRELFYMYYNGLVHCTDLSRNVCLSLTHLMFWVWSVRMRIWQLTSVPTSHKKAYMFLYFGIRSGMVVAWIYCVFVRQRVCQSISWSIMPQVSFVAISFFVSV